MDTQQKTNKTGRETTPPYQRVQKKLQADIRAGRWNAGAKIPSRKDLATEYGVAVATMERAISLLLEDGTLRADGARGTFLADALSDASRETLPMQAVVRRETPDFRSATLTPTKPITATLGIIASFDPSIQTATDSGSFWLRAIINAIEQTFSAAGGATLFFNRFRPDSNLARIGETVEEIFEARVDALVTVLIDDPNEIDAIAAKTENRHKPVVMITSGALRQPIPHVFYDNTDAGYQAAQHLMQQGYRDLLFFAPFATPWAEERIAGAREAAARMGPDFTLQVYPETQQQSPLLDYAQVWPDNEQALRHYGEVVDSIAREMFRAGTNATGLIGADDYISLQLMKIIRQQGRVPGEEIGIVGFDNNPEARTRGLTTLQPPLEALGREAARLVLMALQQESSSLQIRLRSHLLPRLSTRRIAPPR